MANQTNLMAELTSIFCTVLGRDDIVLTPETTAADIDEWDSFNHIQIIVNAEQAFGIKFAIADIEGFASVGDLIRLTEEKLSAGNAPL